MYIIEIFVISEKDNLSWEYKLNVIENMENGVFIHNGNPLYNTSNKKGFQGKTVNFIFINNCIVHIL